MITRTINPASSNRSTRVYARTRPTLAYASPARRCPQPPVKLKPASQSYLHRDSRAVIIGIIFTLAGILLTTKVWLIRLLG